MENQQRNPNPIMEDKDNVIKKYLDGQSLSSLAKEYEVNIGTVHRFIRKHVGSTRGLLESCDIKSIKDEIVFSDSFKEFLIGLMFGDGSLRRAPNGKSACYTHTDKHIETLEFLKARFEKEGIKCGKIYKNHKYYQLQSEGRREYMDIYNKFYIGGSDSTQNRKTIPNITITPTIMLWWWIGDGSSSKQSKSYNHKGSLACKYVTDFIYEELDSKFKISYYKHSKGGNFYFSNKSLIRLLDYIGKCPLDCYKYKWITRRSETIMEES